MDDPDKVSAYVDAGKADGVMAPVYLFHCQHICDLIRPGDTIVDLGCGPATQLIMVAELHPSCRFIGVDLSAEMLDRAARHVRAKGLKNISFIVSDVTSIGQLADHSADVVMSTVALHHLPTAGHLDRTFAEAARILRPGGGVYIVDFGRLKSDRSMRYFAHQYAAQQPNLFTFDYLFSLQAAFTLSDFKRVAARHLGTRVRVFSTYAMPYMVAIKSAPRAAVDHGLENYFKFGMLELPRSFQRDFRDLTMFFAWGGLRRAVPAVTRSSDTSIG